MIFVKSHQKKYSFLFVFLSLQIFASRKPAEKLIPYEVPLIIVNCGGGEKLSRGESLGEGSFGKVHAFHDASGEPRFAVKCPHGDNLVFAREFQKEVSNASSVSSLLQREKGNISFDKSKLFIKLLFYFWDENLKGNVYEYIDGSDLFTYLELKGALSFSEIIPIAYQLLTAVEFLQRNNLSHCDLKPANIMRRSNGLITVIDLGSLCTVSEESPFGENDYKITRSYRSPENTFGFPDQSQSDIWSVGAILAELFLGETLFGVCQKEIGLLSSWSIVLGPLPKSFLDRIDIVERRQRFSALSFQKHKTREQIRESVRKAEREHTLLSDSHGSKGRMASHKNLFTKTFLKRKSFWKRIFDSSAQKKHFENLVWGSLQYLPVERKNAGQLLENPLFEEGSFRLASDLDSYEEGGARFCSRFSFWSCLRRRNHYVMKKLSSSQNFYSS